MKKVVTFILLISSIVILSGCTAEKKYEECTNACDDIYPRGISNIGLGDKNSECKLICIEKYK